MMMAHSSGSCPGGSLSFISLWPASSYVAELMSVRYKVRRKLTKSVPVMSLISCMTSQYVSSTSYKQTTEKIKVLKNLFLLFYVSTARWALIQGCVLALVKSQPGTTDTNLQRKCKISRVHNCADAELGQTIACNEVGIAMESACPAT